MTSANLEIIPEEAQTIRMIFYMYLMGKTLNQIKDELEKENIKTATGKDNWSTYVIQKMLKNEKYAGCTLMQKTYYPNYMTGMTHINNYSKTRKTYEAYRKSGYSKKFFEEHRDELMLHKAAKQAFDQLGGQKVPSRQALHEEFNRLLVEKKQAYAEYRQVKKEMQEYLIAKQTVEHILGIDRHKRVEEKKQQKEEQR